MGQDAASGPARLRGVDRPLLEPCGRTTDAMANLESAPRADPLGPAALAQGGVWQGSSQGGGPPPPDHIPRSAARSSVWPIAVRPRQ